MFSSFSFLRFFPAFKSNVVVFFSFLDCLRLERLLMKETSKAKRPLTTTGCLYEMFLAPDQASAMENLKNYLKAT